MKKVTGIFIAMPCMMQTVNMSTLVSIYETTKMLQKYGIRNELKCVAASEIDTLRNLFVTIWYDLTDFSHMLFVDADMGWPPDLVKDMIWFNNKWDSKLILGTIYAKRNAQKASCVGAIKADHDDISKVKDGFLPAEYVGGGVMLVSRAIVREMLEKMPELSSGLPSYMTGPDELPLKRFLRCFSKIQEPNMDLSEDVSFCERWKRCGGEIWANVRYHISHIGPFDHRIRYEGILEKRAEEERREDQIEAQWQRELAESRAEDAA